MFNRFFKTKLSKVILITATFGLLIYLNPYNYFYPFRLVFFKVLYPFQKIAYVISLKAGNTKDFVASIGELKKENDKLIGENQKLLSENAMLRDMKRENSVLREELKLAARGKFNMESAEVISQDVFGPGNWIVISKGSNDGLRQGMPVIVSGSIFIGKIDELFPGTSRVILATNPQSSINVIDTETEAKGIMRGRYGTGLIFDMILPTDVVKRGDEVVASGIGGDVPRGLLLGKIQEASYSDDRLFQQAFLRLRIFPSWK
jgi:rod shape-determining protein MreC